MEKNRRKRWIAGALALAMCCTTLFSAGTSAAAETDGIYQEQEQAQDQSEKSEEELIQAIEADPELALTITAGDAFEIKKDFTGLKLKEDEKAELKKAAMEDGTEFDPNVPGIYKCVYQVTPKEGEGYLIARNITVTPREAETSGGQAEGSGDTKDGGEDDGESDSEASQTETEAQTGWGTLSIGELIADLTGEVPAAETNDETEYETESTTENPAAEQETEMPVKGEEQTELSEEIAESETQNDEGQAGDQKSEQTETESETAQEGTETQMDIQTEMTPLSEAELDDALEAAQQQDTYDEESGLSLGDVMEQAAEQEVDILELEEGETVTFTAEAPMLFAAKASQNVDVTRGSAYYYADYGLGSYVTYPYTVTFGSVKATAYCVQPSKAGPGDGKYTITKLKDSKVLAKVCYYGTKASGDEGFFAEKYPDFSTGKRFISLIWRHLMPTEAVTRFPEQTAPDRRLLWSCITIV